MPKAGNPLCLSIQPPILAATSCLFVALCYLNKSPAFGHDGPICDNVGLKIRLSGVAMFLRKLLTSCQRRATRDEKITTGRHIWGSFAPKIGFLAPLNYEYKSNTRSVLFPPFLWLWNLWRRKVWEGRETQIAREGRGGEEALGKVLPEIGAKPGDVREIFALMTPCASNFSWARTSFLTPVHAPWPKIYLSPVLFSFALSNSKSSVK